MPDRLTEIRARFDAAGQRSPEYKASAEFIAHAPADIAWLLDELKRLREYAQHDELCDLTRGVAPPVCCTCGLNDEKYGIHDD